jgi:hypothetical protein
MNKLVLAAILLATVNMYAQSESAKSPVIISGYIETYYIYDFGKPNNNTRPNFVYSFNRHNEINLNLAFIKAAYQKDNVRANLALATGTYMNANLAAEPGVLRNIFESKNKNVWVDAGIFAAHIGFESAIGKDCWNLSRSILADNSPYYESGAKISYTSDDAKWFVSGLILNGWQRIQRVAGNQTPAFGHQLTYKPNAKVTLNSSSFIGNDKPDVVSKMRYFHNFYGQFQLTENVGLVAGFDFGMEQKSHGSDEYNTWYSSAAIVRFKADRHTLAGRIEYYSDENGVLISSAAIGGFKTFGYSINYDIQVQDAAIWRVEARGFSGNDSTFEKEGKPSNSNFFLASSLAISF